MTVRVVLRCRHIYTLHLHFIHKWMVVCCVGYIEKNELRKIELFLFTIVRLDFIHNKFLAFSATNYCLYSVLCTLYVWESKLTRFLSECYYYWCCCCFWYMIGTTVTLFLTLFYHLRSDAMAEKIEWRKIQINK